MENLKLNDKIEVSRLIQGFWRVKEWNFTTNELEKFMEEVIDLGITTFDTAEIYDLGLAEIEMGKVFKNNPKLREKITLISKTGIYQKEIKDEMFGYYDTTYARIIKSCEESLKRLNTDYIDIYLIHREDPLINHSEVASALAYLLEKGYVKSVGVSNFDPYKFSALQTALAKYGYKLITNQIEWNPLQFEHFKSGMMDYLSEKEVNPMIWSPLAGGRFFDVNDEEAMAIRPLLDELAEKYNTTISSIIFSWILKHPLKCLPLVGSGKIEWVKDAVNALEIDMDHWDWFRLYAASGEMEIR